MHTRNPLKHEPTPKPDTANRIVELAAIGLALQRLHAARRALLQRRGPSAQRFAAQAVEALGGLSQRQGRA
jgi:hypothetical protein